MKIIMMSRYFCLSFVCLVSCFSKVAAQNSYQSDLLASIANAIQVKEITDTLSTGVYVAFSQYKRHPISIVVSENSVVENIGYSIFPEELRRNVAPSACDFVERYSLCSDLPLYGTKAFKQQMIEDDVAFPVGSISLLPTLWSDTTVSVSIENLDNRRYRLIWSKNDNICCEMSFPIVYELLKGTDIVESQRRLVDDLHSEQQISKHNVSDTIDKELLVKLFEPDFYVIEGDSCYVAALNDNKYYKEATDGEYNLIFSEMYPVESFANLFTTNEIENNIQVQIKLVLYDFKSEIIDVPLVNMLEYFKRKGCKNYFGVIDKNDEQMVIELLVVNKDEGYCHTINLTCGTENIANRGGIIQGRMNSYIPTSKIKFLFEEKGI